MSDTTQMPVIFLAFANDRDDAVGYLRADSMPVEAAWLTKEKSPNKPLIVFLD